MNHTPQDALPSLVSEFTEALDAVTDTSLQVQEVTGLSLFRIEIDPESSGAQRLEKVLGTSFPRYLGEISGDALAQEVLYGTRQVVSLVYVAEGVFLLVTKVDAEKLGRALDQALGEDPGLVLNVSANRSVVEVSGPDAPGLVARMVEFEQAPGFFEKGMAFQCLVLGVPMVLWRVADEHYLMLPRHAHTAPFIVALLDAVEAHRS